MATRIQDLISRAVAVEGYVNPVAYDSAHSNAYGYWICKQCTSSFFGGGKPFHEKTCPIKEKTPGIYTYESPNMIYVLGENEDGNFSPFRSGIQKIKELAKSKL